MHFYFKGIVLPLSKQPNAHQSFNSQGVTKITKKLAFFTSHESKLSKRFELVVGERRVNIAKTDRAVTLLHLRHILKKVYGYPS